MKAQLKILLALSHRAQLIILDEPTSGLDVVARDTVLDLIREYLEEDERRSVLISSHIAGDLGKTLRRPVHDSRRTYRVSRGDRCCSVNTGC